MELLLLLWVMIKVEEGSIPNNKIECRSNGLRLRDHLKNYLQYIDLYRQEIENEMKILIHMMLG